jgi:hypothetical protein
LFLLLSFVNIGTLYMYTYAMIILCIFCEMKRTLPKVPNITLAVADAWRNLSAEEREKYEDMARRDKERYDIEKANYTPPPGYTLTSKRVRGPDAPKRPSSAYLTFANQRRGEVKAQNPDCSNGEISKILSSLWKEMRPEERKKRKEEEQAQWAAYKVGMQQWKKKNDRRSRKNQQLQQQQQSRNKSISSAEVPRDQGGKRNVKKRFKRYKEGDFGDDVVENDTDFDDSHHHMGFTSGMESSGNPNPDEMMAASALQGVRGGPQQQQQMGGGDSNQYHYGGPPGGGGSSSNNGYGPLFGATSMYAGHSTGQFDTTNFPYHHYGHYPVGGHLMSHFRGAPPPYHPYPGFMGKFKSKPCARLFCTLVELVTFYAFLVPDEFFSCWRWCW